MKHPLLHLALNDYDLNLVYLENNSYEHILRWDEGPLEFIRQQLRLQTTMTIIIIIVLRVAQTLPSSCQTQFVFMDFVTSCGKI